ncbi:hypothetical protein PMI15_00884 [Polaromonas sp. CF318]|uniref:hypothetical protein n=1 Tax=Polaromonas sp. CF318 TaxID=1144318 RepID=UPI0002711752|nr:hypothetical protein [Polaromonas sp. CF318]EJL87725.1 hypothetical protein PMI15_00884 [Polaromonas sp. CF318]
MLGAVSIPADDECLSVRVYLRMRCCTCSKPGGPRGMVVHAGSTCRQLFPDGLVAQWLGDEATAFFEAHQAELVPGRCLDLRLYHLRNFNGELRARIKTCALAPLSRSWVKHAEKSASTTEEHHA